MNWIKRRRARRALIAQHLETDAPLSAHWPADIRADLDLELELCLQEQIQAELKALGYD